MNIIKLPISEPVLLIKDFFNEDEKNLISEELGFICKKHKLREPGETGSAINPETHAYKKSNSGMFLDDVFAGYRHMSDILTTIRRYFEPEFTSKIEEQDCIFKYLSRSNMDTTLLSYYENSDYYESHEDRSILTIITYYWKQPKSFTGGSLTFTDHDYTVEVEPWDVVIFPSFIKHQVSTVDLLPGVQKNKLNGRVAISTFVNNRGD